jgi:N-acetylglucosaminyldiphosphoundecaprenol N-acetyl-beta-D-mannosaminyltransferase
MERMAKAGKSVFLFGAKPGVADLAAEKLRERFPGLIIAGTANGYFTDDAPIIEQINAAKPDLLLVGLGAPKQELWMQKNSARLDVRLMIGCGGSLDGFAGTVQRAPEAWQRANLEWLYRLIQEPRRFWRMMRLPLFLLAVIGKRVTAGKRG